MQPFNSKHPTKFIFISGGVMSGLGKGTISAAISALLQASGLKVFPVKADMYLNIDAGTMNPLEHGETFVTDDGLECDQDLGTYERFIGKSLSKNNYFTAGQVYYNVLTKERQLKYGGSCVEAYPHIPQEIHNLLSRYPQDTNVVIIEYGGTVGEYQNEAFFEAARQMKVHRPNDVNFIHVGYVIQPSSLGEPKSKPMQMSIRDINQLGIFPNVVICRSEKDIDKPRIAKIANAAGLNEDSVLVCPNVDNIYKIPLVLYKQNILKVLSEKLGIKCPKTDISVWENHAKNFDKIDKTVNIGIIAKYYNSGEYNLKDSYISVIEALNHAAWAKGVKIKLLWFNSEIISQNEASLNQLKQCQAIIVPQGWGNRGAEGKIKAIEFIRKNKIPYLGLCYGMQMACVEFARNIVGLKDANSQEVDAQTPNPVIHIMDNQKKYLTKNQYGGTIRKGLWPCQVQKNTLLETIYKKYKKLPQDLIIQERHRHRYEFNNNYLEEFKKNGFIFSGLSPDGKLVEAIELPESQHPFFIGTQYHPELISRLFDPHPLFLELIEVAKKQKIVMSDE